MVCGLERGGTFIENIWHRKFEMEKCFGKTWCLKSSFEMSCGQIVDVKHVFWKTVYSALWSCLGLF